MSVWLSPVPFGWEDHVESALREDIGTGDLTGSVMPHGLLVDWYIEAQGSGIVSGLGIVEYLFQPSDKDEHVEILAKDGDEIVPGAIVAKGRLSASEALQFERTALNFLMPLSGVATATAQFVNEVKHTKAKIIDTRKTIPGLRLLQKYAVRCGGGSNHRMGLYDAVMIKDNHIRAHGSISNAVAEVRKTIGHLVKIEVETENEEQVAEAVASGCEVILLDNMPPSAMAAMVSRFAGRAIFEASGGVNLSTVKAIAESGVDVISVGAITHSVISVPFHMELQ